VFDEPETPELSQRWLTELATSANSSGGIRLTEEHIDSGDAVRQDDLQDA
jgi:hypothetical protein